MGLIWVKRRIRYNTPPKWWCVVFEITMSKHATRAKKIRLIKFHCRAQAGVFYERSEHKGVGKALPPAGLDGRSAVNVLKYVENANPLLFLLVQGGLLVLCWKCLCYKFFLILLLHNTPACFLRYLDTDLYLRTLIFCSGIETIEKITQLLIMIINNIKIAFTDNDNW